MIELDPVKVKAGAEALSSGDKIDLHVVRGTGSKQVVPLKPGSVLQIGRNATNDIVIRDTPGVSQRHAEIYMSQKPDGTHQLVLRDKSSRNGIGIRQTEPEDKSGPSTWEKMPSGGMKVLQHGWQLKVPLRALWKQQAVQSKEVERLMTFYITATPGEAKPKPPPVPQAAPVHTPRQPMMARPRGAPDAVAAAQAAAVAAAQAAAAKLKLKKPPEGATPAEIEEFERKRKEKKEKKAKKKAALLGVAADAAAAAAAPAAAGARWRKGKTAATEAPRTAAAVNAALDAELGLKLPGEAGGEDGAPATKTNATRPKRRAKPGAPIKELRQWEVVGDPAVFVRTSRDLNSATFGTKARGAVVHGYKEGDWVSLEGEQGFMMIFHPDMGILMKDMGVIARNEVLASSEDEDALPGKTAAEAQWRQAQGAGIRLTEQSLKVVSSAAQAAHEKRRTEGARPADFERGRSVVAQSVLRDMSVSPISQPGIGRKKKRRKQAGPQDSSEDSSAAAAAALKAKEKKRKRKDALLAQQLQARAGGATLRQVGAEPSPAPKRRRTEGDRFAAAGGKPKTKDPEKKKAKKAQKNRSVSRPRRH
eukprot:TRINITY_DN17952_c0_g1_i1.p1 TRINITY_DN17952_c0_g1~~TRINITY_DN17952_c0_g1_i1.p1  ORF type:complete len:590 (-),score=231.67 TRINITY_DN17952_c0_g1_i1:187-1956(-)